MTEVIDLEPLIAAEAAVETPELESVNVDSPETTEVKAVPEPVEKKTETDSERSDEKKPEEAKTEAKTVENAVRAELKTKAPAVLAKSVHTALTEFMKEHPTADGVAKLVAINDAVAALHFQVAEYKSAAADVNSVSSAARELQETVEQADQLIYGSDDPEKATEIVSNIFSDIMDNAKPESFDGFVAAALEKLKAERPAAYYSEHVLPTYASSLQQTGMFDAVSNLVKHFNAGDTEGLRKAITGIRDHLVQVQGAASDSVKQAETNKADAVKAQATKATEAYKSECRDSCDLQMRQSLGAQFGKILRSTELGTYARPVLVQIAGEMEREINRRLDSNGLLTKKLNKAFDAKDTMAISSIWRNASDAIAKDVCDHVIKRTYPGGLEPRVAKAPAGAYREIPEGRALIVKARPENLIRDAKNAAVMQIRGAGYAVINGKRTLVSWRRNS